MQPQLARGINLSAALSLVAGSMIGTGIFLKTATMAQMLSSPLEVLSAWFCAGLLSLAGALSYAEIGSRFPRSGGEYAYLRESFGPVAGFLYGWTRFWIGSPGSHAAYGVGAAAFFLAVFPIQIAGAEKYLALLFIWLFTLINCFRVQLGGGIQTFLTLLKIAIIVAITMGAFLYSGGAGLLTLNAESPPTNYRLFGLAMISALWAFDGWNNLPMASGEVENPQRNIPRALIFGTLIVFIIYAAINCAYFYALPYPQVAESLSTQFPKALPVAAQATQTFLHANVSHYFGLLFVLSAMGALNGSILTGARIPFAMASDGLMFSWMKHISPKSQVPVNAVIVQGISASLLALSGTFDQLTDYVVFTSWIFYALVISGLFKLRKSRMAPPASYRVPTWIAALFLIGALILLINTIASDPQNTLIGIGFCLLGLPAYFVMRRLGRVQRKSSH